jgi:glycosyltransferase involved in cell wall biosynthesis
MALHPEHEYVVFCTIFNRGLLAPLPEPVEFVTLPTEPYWEELDRLATQKGLDILFRGYPVEDPLQFPVARQVFLIPDIQHEYYPEFFDEVALGSRRRAIGRALVEAGAIGTISGFARQTLLSQPCTRCPDIFLMSPALTDQSDATPLTAAERALVPGGDYFLFPANLWPHKNHRRTLQAFQQFLQESGRSMRLILTGHPAGWQQLHAEFPALPVQHLGFVRTRLLRHLFEGARALLFFSLYEGFGMPLLEAFDASTPVLCSNTTSLPEIGADAVLSCDPTDISAMSRLMGRIINEPNLRAELTAPGKKRLHAYGWDQSAENLHEACRRVAVRPRPASRLPATLTQSPPLVSIVTPSYNQGRFLRRTIESVLQQSYPHIEYRVVDGGSTDESVEILKSYGNRFSWVSERDRGQADAINKGFRDARGEVRAYLNSDDVLLPHAVETAVAHFQANSACDLLYGRANYINEVDEIVGQYYTAEYSFARLMRDCCICQPAAFWRSRIAERVGPFNDRLCYVMDFDYWIRIDRAEGRIEHIHDVLANSRTYPQTKTQSARLHIYREILDVCRREGGYTDHSYFLGLWHHLCNERNSGLPRHFRAHPRFVKTIAYLHHKWWNRHLYTWRDIARAVRHRAQKPLTRYMPFAVRVLRRIARRGIDLPSGPVVSGFWGDNWLAPTCVFALPHRASGSDLHLAGIPASDMMVTVNLDNQTVERR